MIMVFIRLTSNWETETICTALLPSSQHITLAIIIMDQVEAYIQPCRNISKCKNLISAK